VHEATVVDPTTMSALVKDKSLIASVQLGLGQSGAPETVLGGGLVVTTNGVLPFLSEELGVIVTEPVTEIGAGFWPGA
jgi:hypothetical protein